MTEPLVHVGRMIELTEDDRHELYQLSQKLTAAILRSQPDVAKLVLAQFKIVQKAIARSHAN